VQLGQITEDEVVHGSLPCSEVTIGASTTRLTGTSGERSLLGHRTPYALRHPPYLGPGERTQITNGTIKKADLDPALRNALAKHGPRGPSEARGAQNRAS
jgi:hypothetical protein